MIWVPWPKSDQCGLARYVFPDTTKQFKLAANRLDIVQQHGRLALVQHIYEQLQTFGIQYVHEKFHPNSHVQLLRSPHELLEAPSEGTCIDLATLFCGVCLGCDLLPLMVRFSDHALAAVSLEYDRREFEHRARRNAFDKGLLREPERLWEWVDRGRFVAVECTGFAHSATLAFGEDETALRQQHNGMLPFEKAIDIGKNQLKRDDLVFVGDIATLHSQGYGPLSLDIINLVDHLAENLLDDVGKRTAQRFAESDRRQALHDALATSIAAVTSHLPPTSATYATDLANLSKFAEREEVIGQFSQLLKPQKGASLDLDLLYDEFLEAGFTTEQFSQDAFANLIGDLIEAFHDAVAAQPALKDVINIALLRHIADGIERTAVATERTADATESIDENTRMLVRETVHGHRDINEGIAAIVRAIEELPGRQFDMFQIIMATLGQSDVVVDIDARREIQINSRSSLINPAAPTIDRFRILLLELYRSILQNQDDPQQLVLLRSRYIDGLIRQFKFLRLEGLTTEVKPLNLPLERVYVQLRAVAEIPDVADAFSPDERRVLRLVEEAEQRGEDGAEEQLQEAYLQLDALRRERWSRERLERFPISEALADNRQRALVILGDPGSGKTTLLQFLALVFARGPEAVAEYLNIIGADAERLPIYVPLASYDEMQRETGDLTVREFLVRYYERRRAAPGLEPIFAEALDTGQALVLLDGLDEVTDATRRQFVAEQVTAFVQSTTTSGNRVVLTSRIYGYRLAPLRGDLPHITVLDFGRNEIETFARQWYRALALWEADGQQTPQQELDAQRKERELLDDITSNPGVERLAVNPLLLTMLALLRRQVGVLPQRRVKLYDLYVTALIQTWEENRSRGARTERRERVDLQVAEGALIELALWLQQHRQSGTATQEDILARLEEHYLWHGEGKRSDDPQLTPPIRKRARDMAEKFMHDMRHYSGLLIERGQNAFSFRHLTFQEYFAGRALARMEEKERWELVQPHLHSNRWREPLLLATARLGTSDNREVAASKLVERILDADSAFEALLHRDLLLAADCAADDVGVELPLLRRIVEALRRLLESPIPSVGDAARERLFRLTLLRTGERLRLPEALDILVEHLPFEDVFGRYVQENNNKKKTLHKLLAEHSELQQPIVERLTDNDSSIRVAVIRSLEPFLIDHPYLHQLVINRLNDNVLRVRTTAIRALRPLLSDYNNFKLVMNLIYDRDITICIGTIYTLMPLLNEYSHLHQLIVVCLTNHESSICVAAINALAPLLPTHSNLLRPIRKHLTDADSQVREAAINALAPLLPTHLDLCPSIRERFTDDDNNVRASAAQAIANISIIEPEYTNMFFDILSHLQDKYSHPLEKKTLESLTTNLGQLAASSKECRTYVIKQLSAFDWRKRAVAVQVLVTAGKGALEEALPQLIQSLKDDHYPEAWRIHIAIAKLIINDDTFCDQAIELLLNRLNFQISDVWILHASEMRKEAALALGKLKAVDRREDVAQRIAAVLASGRERNPQVLDALFRALSSLVAAPEGERLSG